jgi:hypothetical protein
MRIMSIACRSLRRPPIGRRTGSPDDDDLRRREIARIEELLRPHGLERWRSEDEYGRPPEAR